MPYVSDCGKWCICLGKTFSNRFLSICTIVSGVSYWNLFLKWTLTLYFLNTGLSRCNLHMFYDMNTNCCSHVPMRPTTPGGPVVEHSPGVWEVVGSIPGWIIPKTLKWYLKRPYLVLSIKKRDHGNIISLPIHSNIFQYISSF